jgi:LuxR family maltose regulon positive regulatory protein
MPVPQRPRVVVNRPRLLARLDELAAVTVVRAPLGFGKSTLLRQWLRRCDPSVADVACVDVVPGGGDPTSFWASVVDSLIDAGLPLPDLFPHRAPQAVAARMLATARAPLLLVVDGFENIVGDGVDQVLLDLVARNAQLRTVVALRSHRPFSLDRVDDLPSVHIGAHDLLFTVPETAELFAAMGLDLPPEHVECLHAETAGWPEPTRAMVLALRRAPAGSDPRAIAGAVATEFLQRRVLPAGARADRMNLALVTSLLGSFSAELAEHLTDDTATSQLDWLVGEGLLHIELHGGSPGYRWPSAARRALLAELNRRAPERIPELLAQIAHHELMDGQPRQALRHARQARHWPLVVQIIDTSWRELLLGTREDLNQALLSTPLDVIATSPRALAVRDIYLHAPDDRVLSAADLPTDGHDLANLGGSERARDVLDTGLAVLAALRRRGLFGRACGYADRLLEISATARTSQPEAVAELIPSVCLTAGQTRLLGDDVPGCLDPLQRAYDWAADAPFDYILPDAAATLALAHAVAGQAQLAGSWLRCHDAAPDPSTWLAPAIAVKSTVARLLLALDRLELDPAPQGVGDDPLTDRNRVDEWGGFLVYAHARFHLHDGTVLDALNLLDRARALHSRWFSSGSTAGPLLAAVEADLLIALGRGNQARSVLYGALSRHPLLRVGQARLALLAGDPAGAQRLANDSAWSRGATTHQNQDMLIIHAIAAQRRGDLPVASQALHRAATAARNTGALRAFATVPRGELIQLAEHVPAAQQLLHHPRLTAAQDVFPSAVTLVQLTDREHRVLEKLAEGLTVQEVANALVVSYSTIRTQQRSLYRKLGVDSQPDALARARQWGLL